MIPAFAILSKGPGPAELAMGTQGDSQTELIQNDPRETAVAGTTPHSCELPSDKPNFVHPEITEYENDISTEDYIEDWNSEHKSLLSDAAGQTSVSRTRSTKDLFARISSAITNVRRRSRSQSRSSSSTNTTTPGFISSHNLRRRLAPMHHALRERDSSEVKRLVGIGFDINIKISRTKPLQYATMRDDIDMVRMLVSLGADVNGLDEFGLSPLIAAIRHDNFKIARLLVELGAHINVNSKSRSIPLITAIHRGNFEMVKLLIELGANIHTVFSYGWTPLIHAISSGAVGVVRLLIDLGADVNLMTTCGVTPLALALKLSRGEREDSERGRRYKDIAAILDAASNPGPRPRAIDTLRLVLEQECSSSFEAPKDQARNFLQSN